MDTRHSDAKLTTDATTGYGKTKLNVALGFARVEGRMNIGDDPMKSSLDLHIYPATSMSPSIGEDGVSQNFNEIVGERLTIDVHMRLTAKNPGEQGMAGN